MRAGIWRNAVIPTRPRVGPPVRKTGGLPDSAGVPCLGLNGGPAFRPHEAFSFLVATDDQADTDRLWNAIVERRSGVPLRLVQGQVASVVQITPRTLTDAIADSDHAAA